MYLNHEMYHTLAAAMADDRIREAEQLRLVRLARASRPRSGLMRWIESLTRSRPVVPHLGDPEPQPEVPVEDPWSEAA